MKKVMIGILILIPIIILFVVAMVSSIVSTGAWIAVEDLQLYYKDTETVAESLSLSLEGRDAEVESFYKYISVKVLPEKANRYTINWSITGSIDYTDEEYEKTYLDYLEKLDAFNRDFDESYSGFEVTDGEPAGKYVDEIKQILAGKPYKPFELSEEADKAKLKEEIRADVRTLVLTEVKPAVMLVDSDKNEVESNTSGDFIINSYCTFTLRVEAEHVSKVVNVSVVGDTVEKVVLRNVSAEDGNKLVVGQSLRIAPVYTPIDSIVGDTQWRSDNEGVATVDQNGVITAKGVGSANIYVKASKHGSENTGNVQYVESEAFTVNVSAGASSKFGNSVTTAKTSLTFEELGVSEASAIEGCEVHGDIVTITAQTASLHTQNGVLTIEKCANGEIEIQNADFYAYSENGGYVLAVGALTLKLKAVWSDMTVSDEIGGVEWESSDDSVATVDENGEVTAIARGLVTIRATVNGQTADITLNVQHKIASMQLKTSNESLAVGVARETVFASEKYVDVSVSNAKVANSTNIVVQGEPKDASKQELELFYSAYEFKIISGGEYAEFDNIEKNKLIFKDSLEGKGKQQIVVRVSAKYPRYEGVTRDTTKEVTVNAVYGVEVGNIAELRKAAEDQNEYVHREGILVDPVLLFDHTVAYNGDRYMIYADQSSTQNYAIVLSANCAYEHDENGNPITVTNESKVVFYGSVYGNNHMISAEKRQCEKQLTQLAWSNVVVSNLILRANNLGDNAVITDGNDTQDFKAECMIVQSYTHWYKYRLQNVVFEYCIFENATKFAAVYGSDITINGCIIRNMSQAGIWSPAESMWDEEDKAYYPQYLHVTVNNTVVSNTLGTLASIETRNFTKYSGGSFRFGSTEEENRAYFMEHFASAGVNHEFIQTGFLDIYNWQDVTQASLIKTGQQKYDDLLAMYTGPMVANNSAFQKGRVMGENGVTWFHLGMVFTGTGGDGLLNEPIYAKIELQDNRFYRLYTADIKSENDGVTGIAESILSTMEIFMYGYANDNGSIMPETRYTVDSALISHLHGER